MVLGSPLPSDGRTNVWNDGEKFFHYEIPALLRNHRLRWINARDINEGKETLVQIEGMINDVGMM